MGRPEKPIDPASPFAGFASELRDLRKAAGSPPYAVMYRATNFSASTLAKAADGSRLPTWPVTRAYVMACGGAVDEWQRRWDQAANPREPAGEAKSVDAERITSDSMSMPMVMARWFLLLRRGRHREDGDQPRGLPLAGLVMPDPRQARTPEQFVTAMCDLRTWAGHPSLRTLSIAARKKGHSLALTTLHDTLRGTRLPSLTVVKGFLAACGVSDPEPWLSTWHALRAKPQLNPTSPRRMLSNSRTIRMVMVMAAVSALMLGGCAAVRSKYWSNGCHGLFPSMSMTDAGECVGVVHSLDVLDGRLRDVAQRIMRENENVAESASRYVKIVLLTPLSESTTSASAMSWDQIRRSLEGTHLAQYRANHTLDFGDPWAAQVQVVLANQGSGGEHSSKLVQDLLDEGEPAHPVSAVVGFGLSSPGAKMIAQALADKGIPMISAVASADDLDADDVRGLRSTAPSNTDYARAFKHLLDGWSYGWSPKSGIVVADQNGDDLYIQSLRKAFASRLAEYIKFPTQLFSSSGAAGANTPPDAGTTRTNMAPNPFDWTVTNICTAMNASTDPLEMVFYAGSVADFGAFAQALAARICRGKPLVVFVGAAGFRAAQQYADALDHGNVTVIYPSVTDTSALSDDSASSLSLADIAHMSTVWGFDHPAEADNFSIMYHDAVASAASAIQLAARAGQQPTPAAVDRQFDNLNRANAVQGASGKLNFSATVDGRATERWVYYQQIGLNTPFLLPAGLSCQIQVQEQEPAKCRLPDWKQ